uniref:SANT domain-containing protein n=1 Tax=Heterorhabditis bacteriophora TaxID=37862 RepID=A0A1I7WYZ1_HETBA
MTLLADKGAIRVGEKYQADVPQTMENSIMGESDENKENGNGALMIDESIEDETSSENRLLKETEREVVVYHPHHSLTDRDMDQFLIIARVRYRSGMILLILSKCFFMGINAILYKFGNSCISMCYYLSTNYSCRDIIRLYLSLQMEEWSAAEANLFEEAMEKYGKDFSDVRSDFLPWKSIRDIVEYYYMWKTTNRYVEQKKKKHAEQESKLKQVYYRDTMYYQIKTKSQFNVNTDTCLNRPVVSGQVVARLPPNHPHAHAISSHIAGTMGKACLLRYASAVITYECDAMIFIHLVPCYLEFEYSICLIITKRPASSAGNEPPLKKEKLVIACVR